MVQLSSQLLISCSSEFARERKLFLVFQTDSTDRFLKSVSWLCHFAFLPRVLSCSLCLISSYFFMCVTGFILFARYFGGRSTAKVYSFGSYPQAFQTETHMLVTYSIWEKPTPFAHRQLPCLHSVSV